ncbi:DUF2628 domain-containing protein [Oleomonas cavernae]|uniref:DUF2628 domain-containing protein n=1 Tax=Oleomonas cavernae TaxID=2320859 RepID=A0A418WI61_9PROT|nr:DUF2628 domain-containing protein [Oleomonas cavernae]RJF89685.1 DUF2628 domain-containing protein [Oleomonas cavernae]
MKPIAYTVHGQGTQPILVAERFSLLACLFAPLWLLFQMAWVDLAAYAVVVAAAVVVQLFLLPDLAVAPAAILAAGLFVGFEAGQIRRRVLARHGMAALGVVCAHDKAEAADRVVLRAR